MFAEILSDGVDGGDHYTWSLPYPEPTRKATFHQVTLQASVVHPIWFRTNAHHQTGHVISNDWLPNRSGYQVI